MKIAAWQAPALPAAVGHGSGQVSAVSSPAWISWHQLLLKTTTQFAIPFQHVIDIEPPRPHLFHLHIELWKSPEFMTKICFAHVDTFWSLFAVTLWHDLWQVLSPTFVGENLNFCRLNPILSVSFTSHHSLILHPILQRANIVHSYKLVNPVRYRSTNHKPNSYVSYKYTLHHLHLLLQ